MISCAIVGATGYTGLELAKLLLRHNGVCLTALTTRQKESIALNELLPSIEKSTNHTIRYYSFEELEQVAEVYFLCLPHTEAVKMGVALIKAGKIVIDLSADFRLRDAKLYKKWYGFRHPAPAYLKKATYGLPEMFRKEIKNANLIANPGCYPTASTLAIFPLLARKIIDPSSIVIDAKSGVSGAGKNFKETAQYRDLDENFYAYKVGRHQHTPEIEQSLSQVVGKKVKVTFTAHLLPVERGILATVYLKKKKGVRAQMIKAAWQAAYKKEPFVRVKKEGEFPTLKDVQNTNFCDIGYFNDPKSDRLVVISAIDNLVKGASGQAIQNMNIRLGFSEQEGLLP